MMCSFGLSEIEERMVRMEAAYAARTIALNNEETKWENWQETPCANLRARWKEAMAETARVQEFYSFAANALAEVFDFSHDLSLAHVDLDSLPSRT